MTPPDAPAVAAGPDHRATPLTGLDRRAVLFAGLAFALGLAACLSRQPASLPLTLDNQHYYFVAERFASGIVPHASHFDSKNSLGMMISGAIIRLGRAVGGSDVMWARVASVAVTAGAVALAWLVGFAVAGGRLGGHLSALGLLSLEPYLDMGAMGARPKVFLVLFVLATAWAVARRRPGWAGAFGAGAFLCWQPGMLVFAAAAAVFAAGPGRGRAWARLVVGFVLPVALYELYFWLQGALAEQLDQAFRFPALYMAGASSGGVLDHARGFLRLESERLRDTALPLLFLATLSLALVAALARPRALAERARANPGLAFLVLGGAGSLAFTLLDYQTVIDAFFVHPFVATLVGSGVAAGVRAAARGRAKPVGVLLAGVALLGFAALTAVFPRAAPVGPSLSDQREAARVVGGWLDEGRSVYAVGCTHLLALNRADNHVRYGFFFRGMDRYMQDRTGSAEAYRPLRGGHMPELILVSRPFVPGGRGWLEREYRKEPHSTLRHHGIRVWRRRTVSSSATRARDVAP